MKPIYIDHKEIVQENTEDPSILGTNINFFLILCLYPYYIDEGFF